MAKRFKASGILYSDGDKIGTTDYKIASEYLEKLVAISPKKLPLIGAGNALVPRSNRRGTSNWTWNSADGVLGHAELEYVTDKGNPHIVANITFYDHRCREYEKILQSKERKQLRLGFYMSSVSMNVDDNILRDGVIRSIMLGDTCLGGYIYKFGWEEVE